MKQNPLPVSETMLFPECPTLTPDSWSQQELFHWFRRSWVCALEAYIVLLFVELQDMDTKCSLAPPWICLHSMYKELTKGNDIRFQMLLRLFQDLDTEFILCFQVEYSSYINESMNE